MFPPIVNVNFLLNLFLIFKFSFTQAKFIIYWELPYAKTL